MLEKPEQCRSLSACPRAELQPRGAQLSLYGFMANTPPPSDDLNREVSVDEVQGFAFGT